MYKKPVLFFLLITILFVSLSSSNRYQVKEFVFSTVKANTQSFQIKQKNPVVNEGNLITLTAIDSNGIALDSQISWMSGSPDIAQVDLSTGQVSGIKTGFATITATRGSESFSVFVAVAKVRKANGSIVPGDTKTDSAGTVYISNPTQNVIFRTDNT
ncbi:MAG: hypothetical protein FD167_3467 [bacterium]|nr:MAG: hypothetical protein FD167_3467 [bacterium]